MADASAKVCPTCGRQYDAAAVFCQVDGGRLDWLDADPDGYSGRVLLDQFEIEEKVGAGGMGSVYRARQTTLDRDVAIKILHPELADNRDAVRRFKREARVCTALDHPNVVRVFLFGQLPDDSLYIVMEFLKGRSLLEIVRDEGALPVHRSLHIVTQICDGVGEAHVQGVVHRDLKPENVILVTKARDPDFVKVLDFGIARVLWGDEVTQATQSGLVFGTARYISPEGAAGEPTDARSDVYSLAVIAYQLLAGVTPFDAPSPVAMLMKHIHAPPPHLLSHGRAKHVPEPIADVVMRALAKNPEGRYDDAHSFGDALRRAAERAGFEVHARERRGRPSILPPSEPELALPVVDGDALGHRPRPTSSSAFDDRASRPPPTAPVSPTLQAAPSPFGGGLDVSIPGLSRRRRRLPRSLAAAFVVGVLLVAAGYGVTHWMTGPTESEPESERAILVARARAALAAEAYDVPPAENVLELTAQILREDPSNPEALRIRGVASSRLVARARAAVSEGRSEEGLALYRRALALSPGEGSILGAIEALEAPSQPAIEPGVRTRPEIVVAGQPFTLVAVLEPGTELGGRTSARFLWTRAGRTLARPIEATRTDDAAALVYEAGFRSSRSGSFTAVFQLGRGADRIERRATVQVVRDPSRSGRRGRSADPPPVTTQGSTWNPPTIAPAWTPTPTVEEPDAPPPPPAPWTGSGPAPGSVL